MTGTIKRPNSMIIAMAALSMAATVACAPKPVERVYAEAKTDFGPKQQDVDLGLGDAKSMASIDPSRLEWSGEKETSAYFRMAESLIELGGVRKSPAIAELGERLGDAFYKNQGTSTRVALENSPYIEAAIGETKVDAQAAAADADQMLARQTALVSQILAATGSRYPWPKGALKPDYLVDATRIYLDILLDEINRRPVDPRIRTALTDGIRETVIKRLESARASGNSVLSEQDGIVLIRRLKAFIAEQGFNLDRSSLAQLAKAESILREIRGMESAQEALTVLVEIWEMASPQTREMSFKSMSPELYDYLSGKSQGGLNCLKDADCSDLGIILAKKIKILPALREYGIAKLRNDLQASVRNGIVSEIQGQASRLLPAIPQMIADEVAKQVGSLRSTLRLIESDYASFVRTVAARAANMTLAADQFPELSAVEARRVRIEVRGGDRAEIQAINGAAMESGADTLGASFALAAARLKQSSLETSAPKYRRYVLEQVNKMLAIGGFRGGSGALFKSLAKPLEPGSNGSMDLRSVLTGTDSFAVPDSFRLAKGFQAEAAAAIRVSAGAQAEMLRGLSALIGYFRDWETNGFDRHLGPITAEEFVPQLPKGSVNQALFPKDLIFSVSVGNAAVILQNLTRKLSPVFLIDLDKKPVWANEFDLKQGNPATMAALVDIEAGRRLDLVRSSDVARFLIAVVDFLHSTEGIEKTKASALLSRGADGQRALDVLVDARARLRLLVVGLANFLSHQMQAGDGGIRASFDRATAETRTNEPRQLLDQAWAIRALVKAADLLQMDLYRWSALDAYVFMNKTLFSRKQGFYRASEGADAPADLEAITTTLLAGEELKPFMTEKSREQFERLSDPWTSVLEKF